MIKGRPSAATIALIGAGLLAAASAGIAISRAGGDEPSSSAAHGTVKPGEPVGDVESMIASLEARLKQDPNNAEGWRMLGWSYFETGDFARSATAYRRATDVEPGKAENWSSLGEALQVASTAVVPEAATAFRRALALDAADPRARYFTAVQQDISGQHQAAVDGWIALLRDTPSGAPWEQDLRRTIAQAAAKNGIDVDGKLPAPSTATAAIPGPTPDQLAAASSISPTEQDAMVRGMVEGLAARLASNPRDAEGWIRLMRSRMVLGEEGKARDALRSALAAFSGDAATTSQIERAAGELGVPRG